MPRPNTSPSIAKTLSQIATNMARWSNQGAWPMFNAQGESFGNFINRVNDYCNARGLTEVDALQALPLMLQGEARNTLVDVYKELPKNPTWKQVCEKFISAYYTPEKQVAARASLANIQQGGQSVTQFVSNCRQLVSQAYPTNQQTRESAMQTTFLQGLRPELKAAVLRGRKQGFEEQVQDAKTEEAILALLPKSEEPIINAIQDLQTTISSMSLVRKKPHQLDYPKCNCKERKNRPRPGRPRNFQQRTGDYRRPNSPPINNRRPRPRIAPLFTTLALCMLFTQASARESIYHCPGRGGFIAKVTPHSCPPPKPREIGEAMINLIEPNTHPLTTGATRCTNETYLECRSYFAFIETYRTNTIIGVSPITPSECKILNENAKWEANGDEKYYHHERKEHSDTPRLFMGRQCSKWSRFTATKTKVSVIHQSLTSPHFIFTKKCLMKNGACTNEAATIIWEPKEETLSCKNMSIVGAFKATITRDVALIDSMQIAYNILPRNGTPKDIAECEGELLHPTDSGTFISFPHLPQANSPLDVIRQYNQRHRRTARQSFTPENYKANILTQEQSRNQNLTQKSTNARIQYSYEATRREIFAKFEQSTNNLCRIAEKQDRILHAILNINSAAGARAILGREDISATLIANNTLHITECKKAKIKKVFDNHMFNETCYLFKPALTINDKLTFITPEGTHTTEQSPTIDCSKVDSTEGNKTSKSIPAIQFDTSNTLKRIHFVSGDPYASVKTSLYPLELALHFGANMDNIQRKSKTIIMPIETPDIIGGGIQELAHAAGYAIDKATGTIVNVAEGIQKWYTKYIFWVGLPILVAAFILLIIYIGLRTCFSRIMNTGTINSVQTELQNKEPEEDGQRVLEELYTSLWNKPQMTYVPMECAVQVAASYSLPFIRVYIEDRGFHALWDTGAQISYLRKNCLSPSQISEVVPVGTIAHAANGSPIKFLGKIKLLVRIEEAAHQHTFLVSEDKDCPTPVLLGYDFMSSLDKNGIECRIQPEKGVLKIGTTCTKLRSQGDPFFQPSKTTVNVHCARTMVIGPKSEATLAICFTGTQEELERPFVLHAPTEGPVSFDTTVIKLLHVPECTIQVYNSLEKPIKLIKHENIGQANGIVVEEREEPHVPQEARWEDRLPETPKDKVDFMKEISLENSTLSADGKRKLLNIIRNRKNAFYNEDGNLGCFKGPIKHKIPIDPTKVWRARRYPIPLGKREEVERQVQELLKQGVIEPSNSPHCSPVVLVRKKDQRWRFTVDFRQLNNATKKQIYVIPTTSEIIDMAAGAKFFTSCDLISGFFQIELEERERELTAFTTPSGAYHFRRMPMGLCGSPHTFQRVVRFIQQHVQAKLFVYLDDLLLTSQSEEEHIKDIEELLAVIERFGLKIKLSKTHFAQREVEFLGLIVSDKGIRPNPKKVKAIDEFPTPKSPTAVRSFIGMINYFRRFIPNFATIASPLYELTKEDEEFIWTQECQNSFDIMKKKLQEAPILQGPDGKKAFRIESDASGIAIAAVLLQAADGDGKELHPIAYASRKLLPAERNYPPIETEALALVFAVQEFRTYVLGCPIEAITDHRPLTSLMKRKDLVGRLAKYQLVLAEYDIRIEYRPGKENAVPDCLSRYIEDEFKDPKINFITLDLANEIRQQQQKCRWIRELLKAIEANTATSRQSEKFQVNNSGFLVTNGKIVLPPNSETSRKIAKMIHEDYRTAAHLGTRKTLEAVRKNFTWTNMNDDIMNIIKQCVSCQSRKVNPHETTVEPIRKKPETAKPGQKWHIDILGPLPTTEKGYRYVCTGIDPFTKFLTTTAMKEQKTDDVIDAISKSIIWRFGPPKSIQTDAGRQFISHQFQDFIKSMGIQHNISAPYYKQSNGQIERSHRTIETALSSYVNSSQGDWDMFLEGITYTLNSLPHETTGVTPFVAMHGREPPSIIDNHLTTLQKKPESSNLDLPNLREYTSEVEERMERLRKFLYEKLSRHAEQQSQQWTRSKRVRERQAAVGEKILVKRAPPNNKLMPLLHGPFIVEATTDDNVFYRDNRNRRNKAHKNNIRVLPNGRPDQGSPTLEVTEENNSRTVRRSQRLAEKQASRQRSAGRLQHR